MKSQVLFLAIVMLALFAGKAIANPPYPQSSVITGIDYEWGTHRREAPGSDNWATTWTADGEQMTTWGDGGGFGGTNSNGRVSLGLAKVTGNKDNYSGQNFWGGLNPQHPAQFAGKSYGLLQVEGDFLMWWGPGSNITSFTETRLAKSTNGAASWTMSSWDFTNIDSRLIMPTFCNFGANYADARDSYLYAYFIRKQGSPSSLRTFHPGLIDLARVLPSQAMDQSAYEFFSGMNNGQPTWTSNAAARQPVFQDPGGVGWTVSVNHNKDLDRYFLITENTRSLESNYGIFDAPEPWGPWTTVDYGRFGIGEVEESLFYYCFLNKWFSNNGQDFVLQFSGTGTNDSWNTIEGSFTVAATGDTSPPSLVGNLQLVSSSPTQIQISWDASEDLESGVDHYNVYVDGQDSGAQTTNTSLTLTALSPFTSYDLQVAAVNGDGFESDLSATLSVQTPTDDVSAPNLLSAGVSGNGTEVVVEFSEEVTDSALSLSSYLITPAIPMLGVDRVDSRRVSIQTELHDEGVSYELSVQAIADIHGNAMPSPQSSTYEFAAMSTFDANSQAWAFQADAFKQTNSPQRADGQWLANGGQEGGGLTISLSENDFGGPASGAWELSLASAQEDVQLEFDYRIQMLGTLDPDEYADLLVSVNGTLVGGAGVDYLRRVYGNRGNQDTGWARIALYVPGLGDGPHDIRIGGYLNKNTATDEMVLIQLDNFVVRAAGEATDPGNGNGGGGNTTVGEIAFGFDSDLEGWQYQDDPILGTASPARSEGFYDAEGGLPDGSLRIDLGIETALVPTSGAFKQDFVVPEGSSSMQVDLDVRMILEGTFDWNENVRALLYLDGVVVRHNFNDFLISRTGNAQAWDSGWLHFSFNLDNLSSGTHELMLAAYVNRNSGDDEKAHIFFDNVIVDGVEIDGGGEQPNLSPVAIALNVNTVEDTSVNFQLQADDPENDGVSRFELTSLPTLGMIENFDPSTGQGTYVPFDDQNGDDSFSFRASDNGGITYGSAATAQVHISAVNDPPSITGLSDIVATEDMAIQPVLFGIHDVDTDNASLLIEVQIENSTLISDYELILEPRFLSASLILDLVSNASGESIVWISLFDGESTVTDSFVLSVNAENDAPVAQPDFNYSGPQDQMLIVDQVDQGVLANDTDAEGDTLTAVLVNAPTQGGLVFNADGTFSINPPAGFSGKLSFSYYASDGDLSSSVVSVNVNIDTVTHSMPNPIAYWDFNSLTGGIAEDQSGNNYHGTISGASGATIPEALWFDGNNDYIDVPHAPALDLTSGEFTISAWINPADFGQNDQGRILDHGGGSSGNAGWSLHVNGRNHKGLMFQCNNNAQFGRESKQNIIQPNEWQHIAVTLSAGVLRFYVNGVAEGVSHNVPAPLTRVDPIRIGMRATDLKRDYHGGIDEVRIYDTPLTPTEISTLAKEPF